MKKNQTKQILVSWVPVVLWTIVIFTLSSFKQLTAADFFIGDFALKKLAHVSEYAVLYVLIFRATGNKYKLSYLLALLYAGTDELHQSFVPGRKATLYDLFGFDLTGLNIGAYILWKLSQVQKKRQKK